MSEVYWPKDFSSTNLEDGSELLAKGLVIEGVGRNSAAELSNGDVILKINNRYIGYYSETTFKQALESLEKENSDNKYYKNQKLPVVVRHPDGQIRTLNIFLADLQLLTIAPSEPAIPSCQPIPDYDRINLNSFVQNPRPIFKERVPVTEVSEKLKRLDLVSGVPIGVDGCSLIHLTNAQIREVFQNWKGGTLTYFNKPPFKTENEKKVRGITVHSRHVAGENFFLKPDANDDAFMKTNGIKMKDLNPYVTHDFAHNLPKQFQNPDLEILTLDGRLITSMSSAEQLDYFTRRDLEITYRLDDKIGTYEYSYMEKEIHHGEDLGKVTDYRGFKVVPAVQVGVGVSEKFNAIPFLGLGGELQFRSIDLFADLSFGFNVAGIPSPYALVDAGIDIKGNQIGIFGMGNYSLDSGSYTLVGGITIGGYLHEYRAKFLVGAGMNQVYKKDDIVYECTDGKSGPVTCKPVSGGGPEDYVDVIPVQASLQLSF